MDYKANIKNRSLSYPSLNTNLEKQQKTAHKAQQGEKTSRGQRFHSRNLEAAQKCKKQLKVNRMQTDGHSATPTKKHTQIDKSSR